MRKHCIKSYNRFYEKNSELKKKQKGINKDIAPEDMKDKLRLAICMSQSKLSGLIYNTKENIKNLIFCFL